jgi:hypothetical protein
MDQQAPQSQAEASTDRFKQNQNFKVRRVAGSDAA